MSADYAVFNAADLDDNKDLKTGWYIGAFRGEELQREECLEGPYESQEAAVTGLQEGDWLYGPDGTKTERTTYGIRETRSEFKYAVLAAARFGAAFVRCFDAKGEEFDPT